ncbi:hypothetical protein [Streptomyces sp. SCUT-3]|uniref:hypothetical protein n=1 Tax=Streptomyces sp. SCUT-3 TaxID=2684469 RepID=UPI00217526A3|nr:hypothetical protein [Streptomyces sp. SCUT-3]
MPTAVPQSAAPRPGPTAPRPGRARRLLPHGWWGRLAPVVVLLTAVVHLPSFLRPLWNPDEGFLAVQARVLAEGGALYADVVDRKPPLLPWLHQGVLELLGDDLLWPAVRVLAVGAHTATALLLAAAARHHRGTGPGPPPACCTRCSPSAWPPRTPRRRPSRCSCCPGRRPPTSWPSGAAGGPQAWRLPPRR